MILVLEWFRVDIDSVILSLMDVKFHLQELPYTNNPHAISGALSCVFFLKGEVSCQSQYNLAPCCCREAS